MRISSNVFAVVFALIGTAAHAAATFVIVPTDPPGLGFNETTPATPVGGNPGTTVGEQRLFLVQQAADQWGRMLESSVPIRVNAKISNQTCTATSTVLGVASPTTVFLDFPNTPHAGVWYPGALADAVTGVDVDPGAYDINATFNAAIDLGCFSGIAGWWYGVDPAVTPPSNRLPLLPVVLHEFAHALGFMSLTNTTTGNFCCGGTSLQHPDLWSKFLRDEASGLTWDAMTPAQRQASAINDPNLVWAGPNVNRVQRAYLGPAVQLSITAPAAIAGDVASVAATVGPSVPSAGLSGNVVLAVDNVFGAGGGFNDACEPLTNSTAMVGKIALIERGPCSAALELLNVQAAGAIAALIANKDAAGLPTISGSNPSVTIPSLGITKALGVTLRNASGPVVTMHYITALAGTQSGCVRMHAPPTLVPSVSVSHFSAEAKPNLLMEPFEDTRRVDQIDLTLELLKDIGWTTHPGDLLFFDEFDLNRCDTVAP